MLYIHRIKSVSLSTFASGVDPNADSYSVASHSHITPRAITECVDTTSGLVNILAYGNEEKSGYLMTDKVALIRDHEY